MLASTFVDSLSSAMPTLKTLKAYGLTKEEAVEIQATFLAPKRILSSPNTVRVDELRRLMQEYDCSTVEIGPIQFQAEMSVHRAGELFAYCEADPLIIRPDNTICCLDHSLPDSKPYDCGRNGEHFLEALAMFVEMVKNRMQWKGRSEEAATKCAIAAGSISYIDFYSGICGFSD